MLGRINNQTIVSNYLFARFKQKIPEGVVVTRTPPRTKDQWFELSSADSSLLSKDLRDKVTVVKDPASDARLPFDASYSDYGFITFTSAHLSEEFQAYIVSLHNNFQPEDVYGCRIFYTQATGQPAFLVHHATLKKLILNDIKRVSETLLQTAFPDLVSDQKLYTPSSFVSRFLALLHKVKSDSARVEAYVKWLEDDFGIQAKAFRMSRFDRTDSFQICVTDLLSTKYVDMANRLRSPQASADLTKQTEEVKAAGAPKDPGVKQQPQTVPAVEETKAIPKLSFAGRAGDFLAVKQLEEKLGTLVCDKNVTPEKLSEAPAPKL